MEVLKNFQMFNLKPFQVIFAVLNAAPISLTTSCYGDVVPLHLFAEAISITCIFECIGVFAMPNVAGKLTDMTRVNHISLE